MRSIEWCHCRWQECPQLPQTTPFSAFCTAIHSVVTDEPRDFKFSTLTYHSKSHPADEKYFLKGAWSGSGEPFWNFTSRVISPQRPKLETSNFVHWSAMQSLSLVMSECFLSGRGQGHESNFYIVDLENFATASRRYTGDIHNSTVVGLFMTHCLQLNLQLHTIGLVRTCRISSFCTVAW